MKTLVLRIPEELEAELEAEAKRLNLTKSEVARQRLVAGAVSKSPEDGYSLIADLVGSVEDGPTDRSARKKHYLKATGYGRCRCLPGPSYGDTSRTPRPDDGL